MKDVPRSKTECEASVFEGVGKVKARIIAVAVFMADPLSVFVDMRSVGMPRHVPVVTLVIIALTLRYGLPLLRHGLSLGLSTALGLLHSLPLLRSRLLLWRSRLLRCLPLWRSALRGCVRGRPVRWDITSPYTAMLLLLFVFVPTASILSIARDQECKESRESYQCFHIFSKYHGALGEPLD